MKTIFWKYISMGKILYIECYSGASGDMLMGALLGLFQDKSFFIDELNKLDKIKNDFQLKISQLMKNSISATDVEVMLTRHEHNHRGLEDIKNIILSSNIESGAKETAINIFTRLAIAEAKVHNTDINSIHFHEVGAIDAIVDITGFSILLNKLDVDKIIFSPVSTGSGTVKCAHGIMPVPAPATLEIIKDAKMPVINNIKAESELLTPTGAAIIATVNNGFSDLPPFKTIEAVSYGSGKRNFKEFSNIVRAVLGYEVNNISEQDIWLIETNIDDMQPEIYDYIFEKLFSSGALDVFITPIIMKKTRPACILSVLCEDKNMQTIQEIIFAETTSFGIRSQKVHRSVLNREMKTLNIQELGQLKIKEGRDCSGRLMSMKPEYEDCARIAKERNIPLKEVYRIINRHLGSDL